MNLIKILASIILSFCFYTGHSQSADLYKKVVALDSTFFAAYNNCDLEKQAKIYNDSIEFFHDKGGLQTSKKQILADTEKYICRKITRKLIKGSVEVSPIPGYGAVELGSHSFYNISEGTTSKPSRFVIIWKNDNEEWTITKVISLH